MNDWLLRNVELVNKYQPQLFWFDWWIEQKELEPYRKTFTAYYYNKGLEWNKGVVVNYKNTSYPETAAVLDLERGKLASIRQPAWQTDDAIGNKSWGYTTDNTFKKCGVCNYQPDRYCKQKWQPAAEHRPRSDGTITDEETAVLLGTGKWLEVKRRGDLWYQALGCLWRRPYTVCQRFFCRPKDSIYRAGHPVYHQERYPLCHYIRITKRQYRY